MKKNVGLVGVIAMILSIGLFLSPGIGAAKVIKWKMTTQWPPSIRLLDADQHFVNLVNQMCKGEFEIDLIPAGQLVPVMEVFDAVQTGTIQMSADWPGYWSGKNSAFAALGGVPAGPNVFDVNTWVQKGGGAELALEVYGKYDMTYFYHFMVPMESGIRGNKEFTDIEDFKGSKIRMGGMIQGGVLKDLGAAQTMLSGSEVYQALEKGVIDAAEFSGPFVDWVLGMQDVAKIWNVPAWNQPCSLAGVMINTKAWNTLPESIQARIKAAAEATIAWSIAHFYYLNGEYTVKFLEKGVKINHLSDAALKKIQDLAYERVLEEGKKNPLFAKVMYSQFRTLQVIAPFRNNVEMDMLKLSIPDMDLSPLKQAAEAAK